VSIRAWLALGEIEEGASRELALVRAGQAGDPAALDALLALHERSLFAFCHDILRHAQDAEDAVQETFLRALRALAGFRQEATFRTWLFRIALNVCLQGKASRPRAEPWNEECLSHHPAGSSPEEIALHHLRLQEALGALLPRQRAVLLLRSRDGWSLGEIAAVFGWSERRVEYELAKARRALFEWRRRESGEGDEP
jgi:RNA polymerase sigma-70 factor (ECF subfamily)